MSRATLRAAALVGLLAASACGDDDPTGPQFGDIVFEPDSPVEIGAARQITLEMFNLSRESLGPIVLGTAGEVGSFPPEFFCPGLQAGIDPSQVPLIAPDQSVEIALTFDFSGLDEQECPLATYEVDFNAAFGNQVLGSAQIRLDHSEVE